MAQTPLDGLVYYVLRMSEIEMCANDMFAKKNTREKINEQTIRSKMHKAQEPIKRIDKRIRNASKN